MENARHLRATAPHAPICVLFQQDSKQHLPVPTSRPALPTPLTKVRCCCVRVTLVSVAIALRTTSRVWSVRLGNTRLVWEMYNAQIVQLGLIPTIMQQLLPTCVCSALKILIRLHLGPSQQVSARPVHRTHCHWRAALCFHTVCVRLLS